MQSTTVMLGLTFIGSAWLSFVFTGCSGPQLQPAETPSAGTPAQPATHLGERQLDSLLVKVPQLQLASRESLDAAKSVGTPDQELSAAQRDYVAAEQLLHDGQAAYRAKQYELSLDRLRAADAAFRRAEEAAVRAGLGKLEHELAMDYQHLVRLDGGSTRRIGGVARPSQGSVNLRDGAGTQFRVIGKAQSSETLTILAELDEWYRVRTGTGLVGWVSKTLVTRIQSP